MLPSRAVYPTQPAPLAAALDRLLAEAPAAPLDGDVVALVVPDSNRLAGGPAAAAAYAHLRDAGLAAAVIVSPSHAGGFGRMSVCQTDVYHTPLGGARVDDALRNELCDEDDDIFLDDTGHYHTEGADVQIPWLQRVVGPDVAVVPVVMGEETPAFCRELGAAVGEVLYGARAVVVGSADVLGAEDAGDGGAAALARLRAAVEAFDEPELMHLLGSEAVRVEGFGAVLTTVIAARHRGATHARVLELSLPDSDGAPGRLAAVFWRA